MSDECGLGVEPCLRFWILFDLQQSNFTPERVNFRMSEGFEDEGWG